MTTKEVSKYLKLHEITICKNAAEGRFSLFGSVSNGDSIRNLLMIGSERLKTIRKIIKTLRGKVFEKNQERKSQGNEKDGRCE